MRKRIVLAAENEISVLVEQKSPVEFQCDDRFIVEIDVYIGRRFCFHESICVRPGGPIDEFAINAGGFVDKRSSYSLKIFDSVLIFNILEASLKHGLRKPMDRHNDCESRSNDDECCFESKAQIKIPCAFSLTRHRG